MSTPKKGKSPKKLYRIELTRLSLASWCLGIFLALLWMFLLGLFVGKGITPANINFAEIKKRMVAEGVWPGTGVAPQEDKSFDTSGAKEKIPLKDLEFYEELSQKKNERLHRPTAAKRSQRKRSDAKVAPGSGQSARQEKSSPSKAHSSPGRFTVQVASFKDLANAEKFADRFSDLKPQLTIRQVDLPGKGRWYRVQVGELATRHEAAALARSLTKKYRLRAYVMNLGS